jgi:chromosome segregation ATPase
LDELKIKIENLEEQLATQAVKIRDKSEMSDEDITILENKLLKSQENFLKLENEMKHKEKENELYNSKLKNQQEIISGIKTSSHELRLEKEELLKEINSVKDISTDKQFKIDRQMRQIRKLEKSLEILDDKHKTVKNDFELLQQENKGIFGQSKRKEEKLQDQMRNLKETMVTDQKHLNFYKSELKKILKFQILFFLQEKQHVSLKQIHSQVKRSTITINKELNELKENGWITFADNDIIDLARNFPP